MLKVAIWKWRHFEIKSFIGVVTVRVGREVSACRAVLFSCFSSLEWPHLAVSLGAPVDSEP